MILTSFTGMLSQSGVAGLVTGFTGAGLAYQFGGLPAAAAAGLSGLLVGSTSAAAWTWQHSRNQSDRLHYLCDGQPRARIIGNESIQHRYVATLPYRVLNGQSETTGLHYYEAGQEFREHGTLLLIHGFASNAYQWNLIFDELAAQHHVIAIDLPGHGVSASFPDHDYDFIDRLAPLLQRFLKHKELEAVTLIGSSMGGGISLVLAALEARVKQLILFGSTGFVGAAEGVAWFIDGAAQADLIPIPEWSWLEGAKFLFERTTTLLSLWSRVHPTARNIASYDLERFALPYAAEFDKVRARAHYARLIKRIYAEPHQQVPYVQLQESVQQPTLLVYSEADQLIPATTAGALAAMLPNATLHWIKSADVPNAGHTLMSDNPELTLEIIQGALATNPS